eukprot:scaffold94850_cov64-Phaeocystis_antarctica.AAC.2
MADGEVNFSGQPENGTVATGTGSNRRVENGELHVCHPRPIQDSADRPCAERRRRSTQHHCRSHGGPRACRDGEDGAGARGPAEPRAVHAARGQAAGQAARAP